MKPETLAGTVRLVPGAVNVGVIEIRETKPRSGSVALVDAGLDETTGKKVLRVLDNAGFTPEYLLITHAHADHFGAGAFVKKKTGLKVFAPTFEASTIRNPLLEPVGLYGGAVPAGEMTSKFLLAQPCEVDSVFEPGEALDHIQSVPLPGHTPGQTGYYCGGVLFCADAFFSREVWDKYGIPVYSDISQSLKSLDTIAEFIDTSPGLSWVVPSHGNPMDSMREAREMIEFNRAGIQLLLKRVHQSAIELGPQATEPEIVRLTCRGTGASLSTPSSYYLTRMTILACLSHLQKEGAVSPEILDDRLIWRASGR